MIDKLEMFIALAQERHFGRAAEAVGVTQPTLSAAIRQLEEQLGVMLVCRGSRFQGLTPEGERVLDWARRIVGDARALRDEMRAVRSRAVGQPPAGGHPDRAADGSPTSTAPLRPRHPEVRVTVLSRTSIEILDGSTACELDAGITYLDNEPLGRVTHDPALRGALRADPAPDATRSPGARPGDLGRARRALPLCLLTPDMQNRRIISRHLARRRRRRADAADRVELHHRAGGPCRRGRLGHGPADGRGRAVLRRAGRCGRSRSADPSADHPVGLIAPQREPQTPGARGAARRGGARCVTAASIDDSLSTDGTSILISLSSRAYHARRQPREGPHASREPDSQRANCAIIAGRHAGLEGPLLPILHAVQAEWGHVPPSRDAADRQGAEPRPGRGAWRRQLLPRLPRARRRAGTS